MRTDLGDVELIRVKPDTQLEFKEMLRTFQERCLEEFDKMDWCSTKNVSALMDLSDTEMMGSAFRASIMVSVAVVVKAGAPAEFVIRELMDLMKLVALSANEAEKARKDMTR